jgi:hypothetical protein
MAKTIKNYTSSIPASTSMARIEEMLVESGARDIHKSYDGFGMCDALVFVIAIPGIPMPLFFKLPAKVEKCREALWKEYVKTVKKPTDHMKDQINSQAARTAWKIMQDWVELQLTLIKLEQIEVMEAFLPYVYNQGSKETFYEHARSKGFKQLTY